MAGRVRWYGDRVAAELQRSAAEGVQRAGSLLQTRARLLANRPARRIRRKRTRATTAGPKGSQYTEYVGSRPGQPPALRTGFGRRSITMQFLRQRLVARVGPAANAVYMAYLELGTARIKPRPWLKPAIQQSLPAIRALLANAMRRTR